MFRLDYGHEEVKNTINAAIDTDSNQKGADGIVHTSEGLDPRQFGVLTKRFLLDESTGRVRGVLIETVEWSEDGRKFTVQPDSEEEILCDLVFLAMGFLGPEQEIISALQLAVDARSNIAVGSELAPNGRDELTYRTNQGNIFACGDCRRGQSLVVHAINEGRRCAQRVQKFFDNTD